MVWDSYELNISYTICLKDNVLCWQAFSHFFLIIIFNLEVILSATGCERLISQTSMYHGLGMLLCGWVYGGCPCFHTDFPCECVLSLCVLGYMRLRLSKYDSWRGGAGCFVTRNPSPPTTSAGEMCLSADRVHLCCQAPDPWLRSGKPIWTLSAILKQLCFFTAKCTHLQLPPPQSIRGGLRVGPFFQQPCLAHMRGWRDHPNRHLICPVAGVTLIARSGTREHKGSTREVS